MTSRNDTFGKAEAMKVCDAHLDTIIEILNFTLNSDLTIMYKKVYLKKFIKEYLNDNNKDELMNIIKNNNKEIYDYLFLDRNDKNRYNHNKIVENKKNIIMIIKKKLKKEVNYIIKNIKKRRA